MNTKDKRTALKGVELQHRHFAAIAYALRESKPEPHWCPNKHAQWNVTVSRFVDLCKSSNPRFDRERFLAACGHEQ